MKYRESGMPAQNYWETLLDVEGALDAFGIGAATGEIAELGCGYGTFSIPLAQRYRHATRLDRRYPPAPGTDPEMGRRSGRFGGYPYAVFAPSVAFRHLYG
jgi:hypothetical protein